MTDISIRPATGEDIERIAEIQAACWRSAYRGRPEEYGAEIYTIYIQEAYQRNGLGKRLIHNMVSKFLALHYSSVIIWTFRNNPNRPFYDNLGGKVVRKSTYEIDGVEYDVVGYGWEDARRLLSEGE